MVIQTAVAVLQSHLRMIRVQVTLPRVSHLRKTKPDRVRKEKRDRVRNEKRIWGKTGLISKIKIQITSAVQVQEKTSNSLLL
jgi:hypothetical protein